jgi:hypothetical protein
MILHTLVFSFGDDRTPGERDEFLARIKEICLGSGLTQHVATGVHKPAAEDQYAPVFVSSAIAQLLCADMETLGQLTRKLGSHWRAAANLDLSGGKVAGRTSVVRQNDRDAGWRRLQGCGVGGEGLVPDAKAASGGLMVMVTVQPGWSFCSWRSSQACFCSGDSRRV